MRPRRTDGPPTRGRRGGTTWCTSTESAADNEYLLLTVEPSPVVELNRAAALAFAEGPAASIEIVERLTDDPRLRSYPYVHAVRADLLRRLGRRGEASAAYRAALDLTANAAERDFLRRRISDLEPVEATSALVG